MQEETRSFTTRDGSSLALRIYGDTSPAPRPCILIIHGGGWQSGDPAQLPEWSRQLAALGYRWRRWPTGSRRNSLAGAKGGRRRRAGLSKGACRRLRIDPARFVLLGRSAGGQIALDAAYTLHDPAIRGCIASYAPTDMNFAYWTGKENDMLGSRPLVRGLMGGPPASAPELYHDASPLDFVGAGTPPTLLIHGRRDEIVWVRHSERLRERMRGAGRPVFLLELPWATHGFDVFPRGPGAQLEFYAMAWFLRAEVP